MKRIALTLIITFFLLAVPAYGLVEQGNNYVAVNTDQAVFKDAVVIGNEMYILMTSGVYRFNLTTSTFEKVFDMGFSYLGASLVYDAQDDVFYLAAFKVYKAQWGGGGTDPIDPYPVVTCPLPTDTDYNATNFTVFKLTRNFDVLGSAQLDLVLHEGFYFQLYRAMKMVWTGEKLIVYISGEDIHTAVAHIYEVSISDGFTKVLDFNEKLRDMAYYNGTLYALSLDTVYAYSISNYALVGTYTKDSWKPQFNGIAVDDIGVHIAGYISPDTASPGGTVMVLTHDLSLLEYYHMFDVSSAFLAIDTYNHTDFVSYGPDLYSVDWQNNTLVKHYTVNYHYAYDMKSESVIDISAYTPKAERVIAFKNESGSLKIFWGGYYTTGDYLSYAYFAGTDLPKTWVTEIENVSSAAGFFTFNSEQTHNLYLVTGVMIGVVAASVIGVRKYRRRR